MQKKKGFTIIVLIALATMLLILPKKQSCEIRIPVEFQVISEEGQSEIFKQALGGIEENFEPINLLLLEEVKAELSKFMLEVYELDVYEQLDSLEFYQYQSQESSARGYYEIGTKKLNIGSFILENWADDDIKFIVAHEMIHYIGLLHKESAHWALYEAATAAVTDKFIRYAEYQVSQVDSYQTIMKLIQQMELVNPSIIKDHFKNIKTIDESINEVLVEASFPYYSTEMKLSELLSLTMEYVILSNDIYVLFTSQEITNVYAQQFELYKANKKEIEALYIVDNFNKIKMIKYGNTYVPVIK